MRFLYNIGIYLYILLIRIASVKNKKAAAWVNGRKDLLKLMEARLSKDKSYAWFHFASLGEFEQGRPVLEGFKATHASTSIVITFFSPSGYEVRKTYPLADHVFYLPADTPSNAKAFIRILNPSIAVFTKYEYWYYYFEELHIKNIPLYVISGIFRKDQAFFKWYGSLHREILSRVSHFFVQNEESKNLLLEIGIKNVTVSGDTRFDRVEYNAMHPIENHLISKFSFGSSVFIGGSTWPQDEKLIANLCHAYPDWKFIIAPHEISPKRNEEVIKLFPKALRYSQIKDSTTEDSRVLIIDNIGILSSLYQYASIAYIGGGFGAGIHNTLEAAAFGLPVIFGPNYLRFKEAVELLNLGGAYTITDQQGLESSMNLLVHDDFRKNSGAKAREYVQEHTGATQIILNFISQGHINHTDS